MSDEGSLRFRFSHSPSGVISGVAFKEDGDIVASFRLDVRKGSLRMQGKSWRSVTFTMVSTKLGEKVYDIFGGILSKYGERDLRSQAWRVGRTRSRWRIRHDKMKRAVEEIKKALEKTHVL